MTSPMLVPASHAGSKTFFCIESIFEGSRGSREKRGSRPSCTRTFRARERYSRLMAAAGSMVGARPTECVASCRTRQHAPPLMSLTPSLPRGPRFFGTRSIFQPMSYSTRRAFFCAASFSWCSSSCCFRSCSMYCAMHSPCTRPPLSPAYASSPRGTWHWRQSSTFSPSMSSMESNFSMEASTRVAKSWVLRLSGATTASLAFRVAAVPGKVPAPGLPRLHGWNQRRVSQLILSTLAPITANSWPQLSRTIWPCLKPPTRTQTSSRTSKRAKGGLFSKLPA
mmetsp:Transcript_99385/g.256858  ORF Transcript_99385/g.256858 Transcript_99385/m.256858 type:complete len:281 (-) Transcript_99385:705-1547(-)